MPKEVRPELVELHFLDHVEADGVSNYIECKVWGVLFMESTLAYHVASWVCDGSVSDHNSKTFVVLKSTLVKPIKRFGKVREL